MNVNRILVEQRLLMLKECILQLSQLACTNEHRSIARGLTQQGIVPKELGENLIQIAGYRNRLVHLYHQVANEELFHIISENLDDFRAFSDSIQKFIYRS